MERKTATELEQERELAARLLKWIQSRNLKTQYALVAVGGLAAAGAIIGIGAGTLVVGATGAVIVRKGLPLLSDFMHQYVLTDKKRSDYNPLTWFKDFKKDSSQLVEARELFENAWVRAEREGVSYDEFRRKNYYAQQYRKEKRWDKGTRIAATAAGSFGAFGATHIRTGALDAISSGVDAGTGRAGLGEAVVYGERVVQRSIRFAGHLAATALGGTLDAALEMVGVKPAYGAEMPNPEMKYPQGVPILEEGVTEENRQRTIKMVRLHLEWMKQVRAKFAAVFGTGYTGYYMTLQSIDTAINRLNGTLKYISNAPLSKVSDSSGLNEFQSLVQPAYQAAYDINRIPKYGGVWEAGGPKWLKDLYNIDFKHIGYDMLPQETARALYELRVAMAQAGLIPKWGITITEGYHPDKGVSGKHMRGSRHYTGRAIDIRPTGEDGPYDTSVAREKMSDPWYVFKMLMLQVNSPYYTIRYEPFDLDSKGVIRAKVKEWLTWPWALGGGGMTSAEAEQFLKAHYGNAADTNGAHFHINVKADVGAEVPLSPAKV
ncbi:MAG: hypothetical protein RLZZ283_61 [Candidatus Parcubacteria bacterium]|jgi:hypothetical protein